MDKRASKRWRSHLRMAKLFDRSQRFLVECRILDLSATGARLKPQSDRPLPLDLHLHDELMDISKRATIVWIGKGEIGIRFTPEPEASR
ncbi:PilZ domain-containing protein [Bosea sp. (in: a-proteobacteria)]|uniref:PilZ domain-containing protein n=1 Tax=Bosea sp. (in: a-proteobacteria) TaxID=1871050 RepID=UPI002732C28D|nr:PilZ domain-containing protein [Bosea sp. (in: a-proteobacteria)]MDP3406781.1 PilZ domain-containing protein [Bosea sp. (in: a-proteobacteria)]